MSALVTSLWPFSLTKRSEYAEAGIDVYWVVNMDALGITCHRDPQGEEYAWSQLFRGNALVPGPGRDVRVDVGALLRVG